MARVRCNEVRAPEDGALGWRDLGDRIRERRLEHARRSRQTPTPTIGIGEVTTGLRASERSTA